jgi:hypothetical protein
MAFHASPWGNSLPTWEAVEHVLKCEPLTKGVIGGARFEESGRLTPAGCESLLVREIYWDLMNNVRSKPNFARFVTEGSLKKLF